MFHTSCPSASGLRAWHQASGGSRGGPVETVRLTSLTLASDDSLRRVAYGSRACYKPWRPEAPCGKILLWAFPHIYVRSGYILWVAWFTLFPPNLIKRSLAPENIRTKLHARLRPKGSQSLTRMQNSAFLFISLLTVYWKLCRVLSSWSKDPGST